jgi:hypothetical protein
MHPSNLLKLFSITLITFFVLTISFQANSASKTKQEADVSGKDRLVLMPLRVPPEDRDLTGAMETALVEGLQQKYIVFSGEQVSQKAREIFLKETRNTAHKECDETKCMQNIAMAFQAELLATANVTKHDGIYYLALSVQNIFDNKVEYSKTLTCEICNGAKVIEKLKTLSGVISSGAPDTAEDEYQKEAVRKQRAEQLKKEQQEFEAKLKNADAAERKRLLDAKAADDKRLAELKAAAEARRKNNQAQPTTFPPLELAQTEITKLTDKIAAIETGYEKELADTRKQVKQRYADKLDALENEKRDEFESKDEFRTKQEKKHNELISQRDAELARLNVATIADADTAPLKARIKALTEHVYPVGADGIETELGSYDSDEHQFSIKMRSKNSILKLKLNSTIPLQGSEAKAFKQQWQTGLVRPEAKANFNGDLVEVALLNDADNSRLINHVGRLMSSQAIEAEIQTLTGVMIHIPNKNYEMGKYAVTQAQWKAIMGNNLSNFTSCGDACPVEQVSWEDVREFVHKLNEKTGRQYRLPIEEEWEYACYGGNKTEYCGGNTLKTVAWYYENSNKSTHPVGQKLANGYGLHDMSGNVWQWMENLYDISHPEYGRALRGGSWVNNSEDLRAADRFYNVPASRNGYNGFRLVRTLP